MLLETILYGVYLIESHIGQKYSEGLLNKTEERQDTVCPNKQNNSLISSAAENALTLLHLLPCYRLQHFWVD